MLFCKYLAAWLEIANFSRQSSLMTTVMEADAVAIDLVVLSEKELVEVAYFIYQFPSLLKTKELFPLLDCLDLVKL